MSGPTRMEDDFIPATGTNQPTCDCGTCKTCKNRVYMRQFRATHRASVNQRNQTWAKTELGRQRKREQRRRAGPDGYVSDPEKADARRLLRNAMRRGEIVKQPCQVCGDPRSQGHHPNYSKPLEVEWFCALHHAAAHQVGG